MAAIAQDIHMHLPSYGPCCVNAPFTNITLFFISSELLLDSTSFSLHLDYSIHILWHILQHFCSYSAYLDLSRYFFFYDIYLRFTSNLRMFIVPILTWSIQNTVSVHWKLSFIMLPLFTKPPQAHHLCSYLFTFELCDMKRMNII